MLQCVAVCCSVLQFDAVCCSVVPRVAMSNDCSAPREFVLEVHAHTVRCNVLQYAAVCCSVMQCVAV